MRSAVLAEDAQRRVMVVNRALCELFGDRRSPEELVGLDVPTLAAQGRGLFVDPAAMIAESKRALRGGVPTLLEPLLLHDGRWIEREYAPIVADGRREGHLWQFRDVTEARRLEQALRASETHLQALFQQSAVGMFESDSHGNCVSVNARWRHLTGLTSEQALGSGWTRVLHEDDRDRIVDRWTDATTNDRPSYEEFRVRTPSGEVNWLIASTHPIHAADGTVTGHVGSILDITARRRAEDALRASEARNAAIIATALDAIISVDYDARIVEFNDAAVAIFGFDREQALGRSVIDLLMPEPGREGARQALRRYMRTGEARLIGRRIEQTLLRADGHPVPAELTMADIREADPPVLTLFVRDISDRRSFERHLAAARDQALEASRLKSEFLAVISHEIRTPMYGVTGALDLLRDHELDEEQRELLDIVDQSSRGLMGLIDEILDFSKIEAGRTELNLAPIDPAATVESATEVFAAETRRKGLSLMVVVAPGVPPVVHGDAGRLRQVVTNLVGNAVKFTDAGEVIVRLQPEPDGRALRLEVADSGPGIPEHVQGTLFDPFTQGDPSSHRDHGGTGLGLAICDRLARLMGGGISVASAPGAGTTMTVTIAAEPLAGARAAWQPPPVLRGRTAAVAIGSPRLAAAMSEALRGLGLEIPASVEPTGVDVWVAEGARSDALPVGATIAVLGEDERCTAPLPLRRARLAEVLVSVLDSTARPAPPPEVLADLEPDPPPGLVAAHVLVAEDNDVNRTLALRQLSRLGVAAHGVASGLAALEAMRHRRYDAVLMDLRMPGMDGLEATRLIRALDDQGDRRTPIIAMTADAQPRDRDLCLEAGMDDYLTKPLSLDELRRTLVAWLPASEPTTSAPAVGTMDRLARELGSAAAVVELVEISLRELPRRRAELERAIADADADAVRDAAHVLKSTSALFGGSAAEIAAAIELAARDGDSATATTRLTELELALAQDERALRRWRARPGA